MSERSSFVTEFMHCRECASKLRDQLQNQDEVEWLQVSGWPIIAGFIRVGYTLGEGLTLANALEQLRPCHSILFSIIADSQTVCVVELTTDGDLVDHGHMTPRRVRD